MPFKKKHTRRKKITQLYIALLLTVLFFRALNMNSQQKIMSFNIRFDNPADGEDCWDVRKEELCQLILEHDPDFIGIQESMPAQVDFIAGKLKEYAFTGFGRDGKGTKSESVPIFFHKNQFELLETEVFWLSETPERPSKGWDAALNRITTYAVFRNRSTSDTIHLFNTHFDHKGKISRVNAAQVLIRKLEARGLEDQKVILTGDLNSKPDEKPVVILKRELSDSFESSKNQPRGPVGTFNGFDIQSSLEQRIDYIFTLNTKVVNYSNLQNKRANGRWISDHLPVLIELED